MRTRNLDAAAGHLVEEIPEGSWAQTGQIRRLPEVAAIAQFEHLAPIAQKEMQR